MPRKTKEQKELENKKSTKQTASKKSSTSKKTTSKKDDSQKKSLFQKISTASNSKKAVTKKTEPNKKSLDNKKTSIKKTSTTKSKSTQSTTKKIVNTKRSYIKSIKNNKNVKATVVEYYDLPYRYNQTVVKVLAQTPTNLFIYWDISDEDRENYKRQYGENFFNETKPVLIIHNNTFNYSFEIEINDFANSWYLHVNDAKCDYIIELGRRPIVHNEKINSDYIYVSTSNAIEVPNNRVLFNKDQKMVYFRNVKTGEQTSKSINSLSFIRNMGKLYHIYDLYKEIYQEEDINNFFNISNPSSGNPSSGTFSSKFK